MDRGAAIFQNAPVQSVKRDETGISIALADKTVRARKVLIATNGYTGRGWGKVARSVIPIRLWHTFTKPLVRRSAGTDPAWPHLLHRHQTVWRILPL